MRKRKPQRRRSAEAKILFTPLFKPRVTRNKMTYTRKGRPQGRPFDVSGGRVLPAMERVRRFPATDPGFHRYTVSIERHNSEAT